jgi:hypothetical protein
LLANGFSSEQITGIDLDATRAKKAEEATGVITECHDFLTDTTLGVFDLIVTNCPYSLAMEYAQRCIDLTKPRGGTVALLLRLGWLGSAKRSDWHTANPCDIFLLTSRPEFVASLKCKKKCGYEEILPIDAPRPAKCPSCGEAVTCTTTDASEYAWFVWGPGRGHRWFLLDKPEDKKTIELCTFCGKPKSKCKTLGLPGCDVIVLSANNVQNGLVPTHGVPPLTVDSTDPLVEARTQFLANLETDAIAESIPSPAPTATEALDHDPVPDPFEQEDCPSPFVDPFELDEIDQVNAAEIEPSLQPSEPEPAPLPAWAVAEVDPLTGHQAKKICVSCKERKTTIGICAFCTEKFPHLVYCEGCDEAHLKAVGCPKKISTIVSAVVAQGAPRTTKLQQLERAMFQIEPGHFVDAYCSVCSNPQFHTPAGPVCGMGHGGAMSIPRPGPAAPSDILPAKRPVTAPPPSTTPSEGFYDPVTGEVYEPLNAKPAASPTPTENDDDEGSSDLAGKRIRRTKAEIKAGVTKEQKRAQVEAELAKAKAAPPVAEEEEDDEASGGKRIRRTKAEIAAGVTKEQKRAMVEAAASTKSAQEAEAITRFIEEAPPLDPELVHVGPEHAGSFDAMTEEEEDDWHNGEIHGTETSDLAQELASTEPSAPRRRGRPKGSVNKKKSSSNSDVTASPSSKRNAWDFECDWSQAEDVAAWAAAEELATAENMQP